ncbi:MAG TPA: glycosyltransferase 36 associated protein, partial [Ramlibacter sp.]|nr:glycosyltransferase 36 associated protein [Ramlibacter sp.]
LLNPINHARTPADAARYQVEPYVVAADVYSVAPHAGRGGWTWYTGAAGWMYRAGIEGILGIRREGAFLVIDPCIPPDWPGYEATVQVEDTRFEIRVVSPSRRSRGISLAVLNEKVLPTQQGLLRVPLDGATHSLRLEL